MASLIIALDTGNAATAKELARGLKGGIEWLKVGLELFTAVGPAIIHDLKNMGFRVFLDLKFYDIPNTVAGAVKSAMSLNVDMLTLHLQGGERMCLAARDAIGHAEKGPLLFGVTALTSFADGEMPGINISPAQFGLDLAMNAKKWGMDGVVCSGGEVDKIRRAANIPCLCPGIRPVGQEKGDQRRVMTPAEAVAAGADFLVVGRPVTKAADPSAAVRDILAEMARAV